MRFRRKHRHEPIREYTTNLGYGKEVCECGAYRCRELLGDRWIEAAPHPPHAPLPSMKQTDA